MKLSRRGKRTKRTKNIKCRRNTKKQPTIEEYDAWSDTNTPYGLGEYAYQGTKDPLYKKWREEPPDTTNENPQPQQHPTVSE